MLADYHQHQLVGVPGDDLHGYLVDLRLAAQPQDVVLQVQVEGQGLGLVAELAQLAQELAQGLGHAGAKLGGMGKAGHRYGGERAQELGLYDLHPVGARPVDLDLAYGLAGERVHEGAADDRHHPHQTLLEVVQLEHVHQLGQLAAQLLEGLPGRSGAHRLAASLRRRRSCASARLIEQPQ